jgi:peptidoglycan/xylan/chitin deacetylase (PgdA/CDA1 family)
MTFRPYNFQTSRKRPAHAGLDLMTFKKSLSLFLLISLFFCISCSHEENVQRKNKVLNSPLIITQKVADIILPVMTYHRISLATTNDMTVTPELFHRHMQFLADNNYNPITMDQWCDAVLNGEELPDKPVMITFDDAWETQYKNAVPVLNEFGFKATFYAYTAVVGNRTTMTYNQLSNLVQQGHNVGCHSATHSNLTKPFKSEDAEKFRARLIRETVNAKKTIEKNIGSPVKHFCYPYGYYNTNLIAILKNAGFVSGVTVNPAPNSPDSPLFEIGRYIIAPWTNVKKLENKLALLPLNFKNAEPFDGEICVTPTKKFSIILPKKKVSDIQSLKCTGIGKKLISSGMAKTGCYLILSTNRLNRDFIQCRRTLGM